MNPEEDFALPRPGYTALRKGRVSTTGQVYLVTTVVAGRAPIFANWLSAAPACRLFHRPVEDSRFLAWVLMPDHFHGVLELGEGASLPQVMRLYKGRTAVAVNREMGRRGSLWQDGFHDHALRKEEDLEQVARYVVENPIRAGMVDRVSDYPFWNAEWL